MFSPKRLIAANLASYNEDVPRKYRSSLQFGYAYEHVVKAIDISDIVSTDASRERTALLLATYLAHWGMFRGSSNLKDTNVLFFKDLVHFLLRPKTGALIPIAKTRFEDLHDLEKGLIKSVIDNVGNFLDENGISPTPTLITKMILVLLGNMPAYDRIFKDGLGRLRAENKYDGVLAFGERGIKDLSEWYAHYAWPKVRSEVDARRYLPSGRLVDMAIFQYGRT